HFTYTQNDTIQRRSAKNGKLIYSRFIIPIDQFSIAGYVALTGFALNIPDVYRIDATKPYQFSTKFDEASEYKTRSVLTIPLKAAKGNISGILQIINAQDSEKHIVDFSENDKGMMNHFASIASVALERAQMTRSIFLRMIRMAELRDPRETSAHVNRVAGYSVEIYEKWAQKHNISESVIEKNRDILKMAAMLHDVGKVAISDMILKKPTRLNLNEFEIIKQHTILGARLFTGWESDFDKAAWQVTLTHHERWDGDGYPGHVDCISGKPLPGYELADGSARGRKEEEIPIFGRIVALADVFDALASERAYKEAWDDSAILETIQRDSGKHFDPELVEIFFSQIDIIKSIQNHFEEDVYNIALN
ncbi:MAG: HD domain-containing protein, partial [Desulfobacterales bacterium]|nr:HD domain-containing protein [Desulfobacterales bacterium]